MKIGTEKAFDKIQHCVMTKLSPNWKEKKTFSAYKKHLPKNPVTTYKSKIRCSPPKSVTRQGCPLSSFLDNIVLPILKSMIRQEK